MAVIRTPVSRITTPCINQGGRTEVVCATVPIRSSCVSHQAASDRPESAYAYNSDPFMQAAVTGDVLAADNEVQVTKSPMFTAFK